MSIRKEAYLSAKDPKKYEGISNRYYLVGKDGLSCTILNYGALIESLIVPDKDGNRADIMLGCKGLDEYMNNGANHGSVVGRSANRISGARYSIDGVEYTAPVNDGPNNLHSGVPAFQNVFWEGKELSVAEADAIIAESGIPGIAGAYSDALLLSYNSPDGACGFPGNLKAQVLYAWLTDNTLLILYSGISDKATIFAPTNHSYFNLIGHNAGSIKDHLLTVLSDKVTHKDEFYCPDGGFIDVAGTDFDFREFDRVEKAIISADPQIADCKGLDSNYCVDSREGEFTVVARLKDPAGSRTMETLTDMPGIQIYCGNHLGGTEDQKGDIPYSSYSGICLEAQMYPNSVNIKEFTTPVIPAGKKVYHACGYRFV